LSLLTSDFTHSKGSIGTNWSYTVSVNTDTVNSV